jgi:deoxyribonuclease-4
VLIGAHVSPAGGPANAVGRGEERGARSIQIFNQSPRAWRPRVYSDEEVAAFHEAMNASKKVEALLIHAVYLLNCASEDAELRKKSLTALTAALQAGDALGARGVVLHAGSAKAGKVPPAIKRAGTVIKRALANSENCMLHLENTAGAGDTLGRSFDELAGLLDAAGGDKRLGICLDSCHLYASGFDVRTTEGLAAVLDECDEKLGLDRLGSLHFNDSQTGLGSNRDRHAHVGKGELGDKGAAVWFSEPRFADLPCVLETEPDAEELALAEKLRKRGLRQRRDR